jgi:serine/threonine protein kinase
LDLTPQEEKSRPSVLAKKEIPQAIFTPPNLGPLVMAKGMLICEQYCLIERIGSGGASTVWKCLDQDAEENVALKIYSNEASFKREIKFMSMFRHYRILRHKDAFGKGKVDGWPECCMATFPLGQESLQEMHSHLSHGLDVTQLRFILSACP